MASGARPSVERAVPATTRKKPTTKGLLAPPVSAVRRARKTTAPRPSPGLAPAAQGRRRHEVHEEDHEQRADRQQREDGRLASPARRP